jgi:hypothetical protein
MKSNQPLVRKLLRTHTNGLTVKQLAQFANVHPDSVSNTLKSMPDVYINRWEGPYRGQFAAVWCSWTPPENCPKPNLSLQEQLLHDSCGRLNLSILR